MDKKNEQPWLNSIWTDALFILSPPFFALLIVFLFPGEFQQAKGIPVLYWLFLIVFIDVAHVYSTLYRTYFNPGNFKRQSALLVAVPMACYLLGVLVYSFDGLLFWRVLAYLAVYHFIRQQYGFMRLYSRTEKVSNLEKSVDQVAIYTAAVYPIVFWHGSAHRNFNWFVDGDFFTFKNDWILKAAALFYILIIFSYCIKEIILIRREKWINIPKNLIVAGTFLSWYFGIVYFNGDMAFTTLNVVSHGIPYVALVWFFEKKKVGEQKNSKVLKLSFGKYGILYFLIILVGLAYFEEGLWDGLIWKEHGDIFKPFSFMPRIMESQILALLVPLLALPQSTHYVLDGFIWRAKNNF